MAESKNTKVNWLEAPNGTKVAYLGPGPEAGPLPAFFYFSISAEESLNLPPYCTPAQAVAETDLRVFSLTIPGHEEGLDKHKAITYWADRMKEGESLLETFFEQASQAIDWLIQQDIVDPKHIVVGGLSRGGFVATHLAARDKRIKTILGFAPMTKLSLIREFTEIETMPQVLESAKKLDLESLLPKLSHVHHIRFYMGNLDTRVHTDACYHFIRKLAQRAHDQRVRNAQIELYITQSIGHKGHGTTPDTFAEGADWVTTHLRGN